MDPEPGTPPAGALQTLGERLRQARRERGMSQEQLAKPEFTKSYVSAVERGKARPSLKALSLMARRLNLPMTELLAAPTPQEAAPDLVALSTNLADRLDQAALLLDDDRSAAALRELDSIGQEFAANLVELAPRLRYRLAK